MTTERLTALVKQYKAKAGKYATAKLCLEVGISLSTLENVLGKRTRAYKPQPEVVYRIALACGATEGEARELANACLSERLSKSA